ncbi:MAG: MATE family efflux transporter [Acidobacteriaceae bacterium]
MKLQSIRTEVSPMLRLALPLIFAELGWMTMGIVDTMMVGHMHNSAIALSAAALGQVLYNTLGFGIGGVLLGLDTYISQAFGAKRIDEANRWLVHGLLLAAMLTLVLMGLVELCPIFLVHMPVDKRVLAAAVPFLHALNWGTPPLLIYFALRRYMQAFNHVRPIAFALISANLINIAGDWVLIFGHKLGPITIPAYGVVGSGWSTTFSRCYLALFMVLAVLVIEWRENYGLLQTPLHFEWPRLRKLITLGLPVGGQIMIEVAIFAAVTAIIAVLGPLQLAGHQIALDCASFTFMVPFAISAATSVRVGQAIGRKDPQGASDAGWTGILLGAGFMLAASIGYVTATHAIARSFSPDPAVIAAAIPLLLVAAAFQLFDGIQITANGALRGAGNTHAGLIAHSIGYWLIGMPIGLLLAFRLHLGALGLWLGLCLALIIAGMALVTVWRHTVHRMMA